MSTLLPRADAAPVRPARGPYGHSASLGMALFVFTEVMLFAGFISAFVIARDSTPPGLWPPADQPRLPVERTAVNTAALLLSGVALFVAGRAWRRADAKATRGWMGAALALGALFVAGQGIEWVGLLRQGLTLTSSQLGSYFYLIVGAHAAHAVVALLVMAASWNAQRADRLTASRLGAVEMFWYFVVLAWPLIYWQVYR